VPGSTGCFSGCWLAIVAASALHCAREPAPVVEQPGGPGAASPARPPATGRSDAADDLTIAVVTEASLPAADERAMVARVRAAFGFALRACGWSRPDAIAAAPLELHVAALPRGTLARTTGPGVFSVDSNGLHREDLDGVLAHELTHLQDFRVAGGGLRTIPRYLVEGRALGIGRAYRSSLAICGSDLERARAIEALTGEQAAEALRSFRDGDGLRLAKRTGNVFRWMAVGVFFVEFLRVRAHGTGWPDAMARLSRTWERVGQGETFDRAFAAEFAQSLRSLEEEFVAFVASTEKDSADRLRGTAYDSSSRHEECAVGQGAR
jgi:hypothetical protein